MDFDATIDLAKCHCRPGLRPRDAVDAVRAAVEALPGANWISVDYGGDWQPVRWIVLYQPGSGRPLEDACSELLRQEIAIAVHRTVG
jgi:hypothetical protein